MSQVRRGIYNEADALNHAKYPLLFDPQTAGGIMAFVPLGTILRHLIGTTPGVFRRGGGDVCGVNALLSPRHSTRTVDIQLT